MWKLSHIERGTSESFKNAIFERLKIENMLGQCYDTTSTISSDANELEACIGQDVPKAI